MEKLLFSSFNSLKYVLISIFLLSCSQVNQTQPMEKLQYISITSWGGENGYHRSLQITADSLFYEFGSAVDTVNNVNIKKVNSRYKLEDFIAAKELTDFSKIQSGESRQPVDGTDTEIKIKTDKTEYKVINAGNNSKWRNIENKLSAIIETEFKEVK
ncbi:MAG: hypothetical protein EOP00_27870 [Pedobacter sp.]|nr:MAG: hypothetical protein EOP00_27870 [Pedobacter sp.]